MKYNWKLIGILMFGAFLRLGAHLTNIPKWLNVSFEATTPQNSWRNFLEARFLVENGVSPFDIVQSSYHETPIAFVIWRTISVIFVEPKLLFAVLDLAVCVLLYLIGFDAGKFLLSRQREAVVRKRISPRVIDTQPELLLRADSLKQMPYWVATAYALNPYSIMSCIAFNTNVLNTIVVLCSLLAILRGRPALAAFFAALGAYLCVYPLALLVPILICDPVPKSGEPTNDSSKQADRGAARKRKEGESIDELLFGASSRFRLALVFVAAMSLLVAMSGVVQMGLRPTYSRTNTPVSDGSASVFSALAQSYSFILTVPDLRPNIGLFWYFFTEVFEHFLSFFLAVFQIQIFIYAVPLSIKFRDDVLLVFYALIGITCIFRSYPSYSDVGLLLSLTPLWSHLRSQMRSLFISAAIYITCTFLLPILSYLWIYQGSANSNFYYGVSLAFNIAQIFLVTDVVYAYSFRLFSMRNNFKLPRATTDDAKKSKVTPTLVQYDDATSSRTAA